ncbi:MAG: HYR domain-containing protein, partial [Verrucomicrobiota bacterium]
MAEVKTIASGHHHALALKNDGTVVAWGDNNYGKINVPAGLAGVQAVAAGGDHSVALKNNGTVVAWGRNTYGQTNVPAGLAGVQAIVAGVDHTVALKSDGKVVAWGFNSNGETNVPAGLTGVKAIASGGAHTVALKNDGSLVGWGRGEHGQISLSGLGNVRAIAAGSRFTLVLQINGSVVARGEMVVPPGITNIKSIAAGGYHAVALRNDGTVVAWSADGVIGAAPLTSVPAGLKNVEAVTAGESHTLALRSDNATVDFGTQNLRVASEAKVFTLRNIGAAPLQITQASTQTGSFALVPDFFVDTQGMSNAVPAGGETTVRVRFKPGSLGKRYASLYIFSNDSAGYNLTLTGEGVDMLAPLIEDHTNIGPIEATSSSGAMVNYSPAVVTENSDTPPTVTYSQNSDTLFPIGVTTVTITAKDAQNNTATKAFTVTVVGPPRLSIEQPSGLALTGRVLAWGLDEKGQANVPSRLVGVKSISAGESFTAALKTDGTVVAWGDNQYGQLNVPAGLKEVRAIATGAAHTLALKDDGTIVAWGLNTVNQASVPNGLSNVQAIAAGANHNLALRSDGTVMEWGTPNPLGYKWLPEGLDQVKAIATAGHSVVLKTDGTVLAWGYSPYDQTLVPSGLKDVQAIAVGGDHTLALKADGTVVAWGSNLYGQTNVPVGLAGVQSIAAGRNHSLALKHDGTVVAWGSNLYGQADVLDAASGIQAIAAGFGHSAALVRGTPAVEFGDGNAGQGSVVTKIFILKNSSVVALNLAGVTVGGEHPADFKVEIGGLFPSIPSQGETMLTVTFTPGGKGRRNATLRITSDDPIVPIYDIVMSGAGIDATAPFIAAHANIGPIEAVSAAGAVVTYPAAVATDDSGQAPVLAYSRNSGSIFPVGVTTVIVSAMDAADNVSNSTFTVTVKDMTPPSLALPANRRVVAESASGSIVAFTPTATDLVDVDPVIVSVPASGSTFPIGETTVQVTATDNAGNVSHGSFKVIVRDEVPPQLVVISPAANGRFASDKLVFSGVAKDDRAVERVEIVLNGGARQVVKPSETGANFEWTLSTRPESGSNTAVVTAYDRFGNPSAPVTRTFHFALMRPAFAGSYNGLFEATEASLRSIDHHGLLGITVLATGTFTGKVTLCGTVFPISGVFQNEGGARFGTLKTTTLQLRKKELSVGALALALDTTPGAERITGTLSKDGSVVSVLDHADHALYTAKKNPAAPLMNVPVTLLDPSTDNGLYTALFLASDAPNNGV